VIGSSPAQAVEIGYERLLLPIDGGSLALTKLNSSGKAARATVLINCAMGVRQSFYGPFAQFLAGIGYSVYTWDYRGVGESTLDRKSARNVSLEQWAYDDLSLVISAAAVANPELPIIVVGHSFGGQIISLPENRGAIAGALLIACPSGYVGHWRGKARGVFLWALAHVGIPVSTRICGYFPAARLGLGADLPRRVALEWAGWLRHPRYIGGSAKLSERIASFNAPIHAMSMSDDDFAPSHAVDAMLSLFSGSAVTRELVAPDDHGLPNIGHMGFFRSRSSVLWQFAADRIDALLSKRTKRLGPHSRCNASIDQ